MLDRADVKLIDNTVKRIPAEAVVSLITVLQKYIYTQSTWCLFLNVRTFLLLCICSSGDEGSALQPGAPAERQAGAADHAYYGQAGGFSGGHKETGTIRVSR